VVPALRFAENSACMTRIELAIYLMGDADKPNWCGPTIPSKAKSDDCSQLTRLPLNSPLSFHGSPHNGFALNPTPVSTGCWAHRRGKIRINADLSYDILSHEGVVL